MRVLVTGHRGYLGSVMTAVLQNARFDVVGLDSDLYDGCDFGRMQEPVPAFDTDVRDIEFTDLLSFDAVVHLAGLPEDGSLRDRPGDPACWSSRSPRSLLDEVNHRATIRLAECCKEAGVSRFLFASSCAVYGRGGGELLSESSPAHPQTAWAASKVRCERDLSELADETFTPVFLRNASAYGVSPRLRVDLEVNDLAAAAAATGYVTLRSQGTAHRPLVHVEDIARAFAAVLLAPSEIVRNQVFNIVRCGENHRTIDVINTLTDLLPDCQLHVVRDRFDPHSYRVDGSKLQRTFPSLSLRWTLQHGIRQLYSAMQSAGLTPAQWRCDRYRRLLRLETLVEQGQLSDTLRKKQEVALASSSPAELPDPPIRSASCFDRYRTISCPTARELPVPPLLPG